MTLKGLVKILTFVGLSLLAASLWATPSITNVTGTVSHGNTLTITGTSFATISTTTGVFDLLESGSASSYWADTTQLADNTTNLRTNATHNMAKTITSMGTSDVRFQAAGDVARSFYTSYWWKVSSDWDWGTSGFLGLDKFLANIKLWRMWNPGSFAENVYCQYKGDNDALQFITEGMNGELTESMISGARAAISLNTWHLFRFQFVDSSAAGVADCHFKFAMDAGDWDYTYDGTCKEDENVNKRALIIGMQNEWGCDEGVPDTEGCGSQTYYIDNVYYFDTIARVEICDNATYASCTIPPEAQTIKTWADTSITITYNAGELTANKYLFVVDNTGAVSSGFLLGSSPGGGGSSSTAAQTKIGSGVKLSGKVRL